jgi:hypothetical protein
MELIREHLMYKDVPLTICVHSLTSADHYELLRCLLATRTNNVSICCTESSNVFIQVVLKKLPLQLVGTCSATSAGRSGVFSTTGSATTS